MDAPESTIGTMDPRELEATAYLTFTVDEKSVGIDHAAMYKRGANMDDIWVLFNESVKMRESAVRDYNLYLLLVKRHFKSALTKTGCRGPSDVYLVMSGQGARYAYHFMDQVWYLLKPK
jgi:hypothetical protein